MRALRIVVVGPGRAGGALALAARRAGHELCGIVVGPSGRIPAGLEDVPKVSGVLPAADLAVVAVRDDDIAPVAASLVGRCDHVDHVCHLSGFTSVDVLGVLRSEHRAVGSLHPVQSLPDPVSGSWALAGSYAALTGDTGTIEVMRILVESIGMTPFVLEDRLKPLHHAAAAAAANFVTASLALATGLGERAGVPAEAYRALTDTSVAHAWRLGALASLTGPIARGDVGTVVGQLDAVDEVAPGLASAYASMIRATAALTPHAHLFETVIGERS